MAFDDATDGDQPLPAILEAIRAMFIEIFEEEDGTCDDREVWRRRFTPDKFAAAAPASVWNGVWSSYDTCMAYFELAEPRFREDTYRWVDVSTVSADMQALISRYQEERRKLPPRFIATFYGSVTVLGMEVLGGDICTTNNMLDTGPAGLTCT